MIDFNLLHFPDHEGPGIYKIALDSGFYIGSAMNVQNRLKVHAATLNSGKGAHRLQDAANRTTTAHFELLEKVDPRLPYIALLYREQFYIETLRPELNDAPVRPNLQWEYESIMNECKNAKMHVKRANKLLQKNDIAGYEKELNYAEKNIRYAIIYRNRYLIPMAAGGGPRRSWPDYIKCPQAVNTWLYYENLA